MSESVLSFSCEGEQLVGILAEPDGAPADTGVLIIVGGPQYRAGSHRQFTLLARHLAASGFSVLRFDYRGMGDGTGVQRDFLGVEADIGAAISAFQAARPAVRQVILWGLCDAASAALLYIGHRSDPRVRGLCLINPWARSAASLAKATVKHYYRRRLLQKEFWQKLGSGQLGISAIQTLVHNVWRTLMGGKSNHSASQPAFQDRMLSALQETDRPCLLILSSLDQTAQEFVEYARSANIWDELLRKHSLKIGRIQGADHTLSRPEHQQQMFTEITAWVESLVRPPVPHPTMSQEHDQ